MTSATDNKPNLQSATQKAISVKQAYQDQLMALENVMGVGVGFRKIGGVRTNDVAIVVMVKEKYPRDQLAPKDVLPAEIEGIPVDVQVVGEFKAFD